MTELSYEQVNALLRYEADTGKLYWLPRPRESAKTEASWKRLNTRFAGNEAFTARSQYGYRVGRLLDKHYAAHRIAWLLHHGEWPSDQIDHINGDRADNRIANLRDVTCGENQKNKGSRRDNTSGVSGIHWHKPTQKWHVRVGLDGKMKHIGYFGIYEEALAARAKAHATHGYTDRHGVA